MLVTFKMKVMEANGTIMHEADAGNVVDEDKDDGKDEPSNVTGAKKAGASMYRILQF